MSAIAHLREVQEHFAAPLEQRDTNVHHEYGQIEITTSGAREDDPRLDALPVNRARDYDLVRALALRGYDVRVREPNAKDLARAKNRSERIAATVAVCAFLEWGCFVKASSGVLSAGLALPFALPTFARAAWWCSGLSLGSDGRECLLVLSLILGALLVFAAVLLRAQEGQ